MKLLLALVLLPAATAGAADWFVTPGGSGARDGSSAADAAPAHALSGLFDRMAPADRLKLGPGDYADVSITLRTGGTPGKPKILEGEAGTRLTARWTIEKPDKGGAAITLAPGLSDVVIRNLSIARHGFAVRAQPAMDAPRARLAFENLAIEQVRHGFYLSDCDDLTLTGCTLKRYSKHGFRFEQGCDRVTVKGCVADCSEGDAAWETRTEVFPFGFLVGDGGAPSTRIRFEDCIARNHIKSNQTVKYPNGDGFVVEGNNRDVAFVRCRALRNQDGGFDIKVKDATFDSCIAIGHRRDFRIWSSARLKNCFAGGSQTGLWTKGGPVVADGCTFLGHRKSAIELDDGVPGPVTLHDCLIASAAADFTASIGKYDGGNGTVVAKSPAEIGLPTSVQKWDGEGAAMNSSKFPAKGFSSQRIRP
jgi:hypothetical protein